MDATVKLGGVDIRLAPPASPTVRWDILVHKPQNYLRANAAALGVCWRGKNPPKANLGMCGYSIGMYGGKVLDELLGRGLEFSEINAAGETACALLVPGLVSEQEVAAAEDYFPEPEGDDQLPTDGD